MKTKRELQLEIKQLNLDEQRCPNCHSNDIGIDSWGMFPPERDFFYYCKKCDNTF